jgi:hypothetical protein
MRCVIKKNVQTEHYCNGCSINNTFPSENHILMSYRLLEVDKVKKNYHSDIDVIKTLRTVKIISFSDFISWFIMCGPRLHQ